MDHPQKTISRTAETTHTPHWNIPPTDLQQKINILQCKLEFLKKISKSPPSFILTGFQEVDSLLQDNWKDHVYYILLKNNISPVWILDIINLEPHKPICNRVLIQFVSHDVKTKVCIQLRHFIKHNNYKKLAIDEYMD